MATTLPRGIQLVRKPTTIYYRVKVSRKDFKCDKYFKDINEAKAFLALTKAKKGQELIYSVETEKKQIALDNNNYEFGYFVDLYAQDYIKEPTNELQRRNRNNKLSFLKTIKNTSILDRNITLEKKLELALDPDEPVYKFLKGFDVREIRAIDINNYIKTRLKTIKPISVSREITFISNVYRKLQYFNESLADLTNPTKNYDKELLGHYTITKREVILSQQQEELIYSKLIEKSNKDLYNITRLSLLTAMRRSEIVYLTQEQVKSTYIQLTHTKSNKPRKVYLTKDARDFITTLKPNAENGRFFSYSIGGFEKMWTDFLKSVELHKKIRFHDLRRTNISRLLSKIGQGNSVLATEILGLQSVRKFEELHSSIVAPEEVTTQEQAMKSLGHASGQQTKHYYNITEES
ncbi:site-specific integrase [Acidovorax sp. SUPP2539]|uniref:site-specific integrase n=1 Tax=Acidovorax sp. SUPP2539 TaxID=2920878 RepID=UPI0023DE679D|nr:site-specific integrase [Acidovorax sp. SUPP2539]GKS91536.1 site-specific integrase [Acidovorax sp. SUPP2539]